MCRYAPTLSSARAFSEAERLDVWIHEYLCSDGRNPQFSAGLRLMECCYIGPIAMPTDLFERCTGPEESMTFRTDRDIFARHVAELERHILGDPDMAPLIVSYTAGGLVTNDGNHRLQAYKNLGIASVPVIIWLPEPEYRIYGRIRHIRCGCADDPQINAAVHNIWSILPKL